MLTLQQCSDILVRDWGRLQQIFIAEAIADWDEHGEGWFIPWVRTYVNQRWLEHARRN